MSRPHPSSQEMYEEDDDAKHESSVSTEVEIAADRFVNRSHDRIFSFSPCSAYVTADSESDPKAEKVINFGHWEGNMNLYPATAFPITCLLCRCHMCFVLSSFSW
ncbi:predicted protein [Arabidopsis lyrata subsp. lyrata]|uniref:Predicted protein n=1 Tax=Arabidopsis lyrata subsp. lyrata TaxID=81972 RepID=D7MJ20_ARALL|nr:predicted protein [Arabidopsis lyrata subsp. lyrata]